MEQVNIIGVGMTRFGVLDESLEQLAAIAATQARTDSQTLDSKFDYLFVGAQNPDEFANRGNVSTLLSDHLGLVPAGAAHIETGPSSGASAFEIGFSFIASGHADLVMVLGVEKMSGVDRNSVLRIINKMISSESESHYGATPAALAALMARRYMHDYGLTRDDLSLVPVKAHRNGAKNPLAHFQKEITIDDVKNSRIVADPLTLYDCCPTSDGAAAAILASNRLVKELELKEQAVRVAGISHATDYLAIQHRQSLTSLSATGLATDKAFRMADLQLSDIDVFEVHDAFSILEIINMEDLGLVERGKAINLIRDGTIEVTGDKPVNTMGGLKARGHPTGASGVAQIHDLVLQLRGIAPKGLQVDDPHTALAHNIGGFGNNIIVSLLTKSS